MEVGERVRGLHQGDLVVATVRRPDGCPPCQAGEPDFCLEGNYTERGIKGRDGYLTQMYADYEAYVVQVNPRLGDSAVLLEPASVAEKALRQAWGVQRRLPWEPKAALVAGTGTLGLLRLRGLTVAVADRSDDQAKARLLAQIGARHFNTGRTPLHDIPEAVGAPLNMIFEATGSSTVALHAMSVVGTNGVVVLMSITGGDKRVELCADCLNQGLVLGNKAVVGSVSSHRRDFEAAKTRWPGLLEGLITARYPLEAAAQALAALPGNIKVVIEL